jgi:hypothetical protein
MELVVARMVLKCWVTCQNTLKVILESSLVVWLASCVGVGKGSIHAPEKVQRRFSLVISREFNVELLACHLCEIIFTILDSTFAQKMQEGVTITIWKLWIST